MGPDICEYDDSLLAATLRVIVTVVASLLPVCSVVVQYFVTSDLLRLATIIAASTLFALALALMTNARMIEVFAATSACVSLSFAYPRCCPFPFPLRHQRWSNRSYWSPIDTLPLMWCSSRIPKPS